MLFAVSPGSSLRGRTEPEPFPRTLIAGVSGQFAACFVYNHC